MSAGKLVGNQPIEFRAPEEWVQDQVKEISAICHFEFRMMEVLVETLQKVENHLRGISALWGKDLDVLTEFENPEAERKANVQDVVTYEYLISLANFLANERVSLDAFRQQLMLNVTKTLEKRFKTENENMNKVML